MHTKKSTKIIFNSILAVLGAVWITPLFFVVLNIVKTKQEYKFLEASGGVPFGTERADCSGNRTVRLFGSQLSIRDPGGGIFCVYRPSGGLWTDPSADQE